MVSLTEKFDLGSHPEFGILAYGDSLDLNGNKTLREAG